MTSDGGNAATVGAVGTRAVEDPPIPKGFTDMRRLVALLTLVSSLTLLALPASARSLFIERTSGQAVTASWTQYDRTPTGSAFGNVHVGWLNAYAMKDGTASAFAWIDDFDCEAGQEPWGGHGGAAECTHLGSRLGEGYDMTLQMGSKLTSARLTGTLTIYHGGHGASDGSVLGSPAVDISLTGVGSLAKGMSTYRWQDEYGSYSGRYRSTSRQATVSGSIGAMGFDPATSSATIETFTSQSRSRTR